MNKPDTYKAFIITAIFILTAAIPFVSCNTHDFDIAIAEARISAKSFISDEDVPEVLFNRIYHIKTDSQGNIYLLDTGEQHILKFSMNGEFIQTIGSKGEGPGEFTGIVHFTVAPDDRIYAIDNKLRRISIFESNGDRVLLNNIRGAEMDSIYARKAIIVERNRNRGATLGPNMMIAVGYFTDFTALNDTTFIATTGTGDCFYRFNERGDVVKKLYIETDIPEVANSLYMAAITIVNNEFILASDPGNLTIWKMRLSRKLTEEPSPIQSH